MSSRLVWGLAVASLIGLIWISVGNNDAMPAAAGDSVPSRAQSALRKAPARAAAHAGGQRNPGGLPARDRSAGRVQTTPGLSAAPRAAATYRGAAAAPARPASNDAVRARRELSAVSASPAHQPSEPGGTADAADEAPRSRGIGGSVRDKSGAGAAGLAVGLKARRVFNGAAAGSAALQTTTDGRGGFTFGAVPDGEYEIRTEKTERYESAFTLVRAGTDSAVLVVEAAADGAVSIHGVVESTAGGILAGVRVEVIGRASIAASTDAKGAYALRVPAGSRLGQTALRFRRTGYRDRRWAMSEGLRASDYDVIGNVRLEPVTAGVSVSGVVSSKDGAPVARAQVQLSSAALGRGYSALTDGAGRFMLANVDAGSDYRLWVRPQSGFKDGILDNLQIDAATPPLDVALTPIGAATLRGRMVTPDGASLPGFTMWLTAASGGGPRSLAITGDAQGRFVVPDLPEGAVALQTRAAPVLSVTGIGISAGAPGATDVTVVVDVGPHRLDGRLVTAAGAPAAAARVALEWSDSRGGITSRSTRETTTDADGAFVFTQLGGGVHIVSASLAGAGSVRLERAIGAGAQPVLMTLPGRRGHQ
jgi:hypothetical protein